MCSDRISVLDLDRKHLGRYVDTGSVAGTLTVLQDAHHNGSPCRTLIIDTVAGEIVSVTSRTAGPEFSHLPWSSMVQVDSSAALSGLKNCHRVSRLSPDSHPPTSDVAPVMTTLAGPVVAPGHHRVCDCESAACHLEFSVCPEAVRGVAIASRLAGHRHRANGGRIGTPVSKRGES